MIESVTIICWALALLYAHRCCGDDGPVTQLAIGVLLGSGLACGVMLVVSLLGIVL